ncbi:MAG TPA: aspartate:alanine exchanger family transporter [Anaerolineaceae bacterium]|nr:aspartate:alanine exchanger family transporter [Anaerolineaceae bacterium]HNS36846.1 aspartate:alanine exchanger family transporter [Anaerolineaceae bacterium]
MSGIIRFLSENPLLLLFIVAGIGYPLGRIKIGGASLGVSAVLFVGLAIGALSPDLKLPASIYELGVVLFVYCIGLSSGSIFFSSMKRQGLKANLLILGGLLFAAGLAALAHYLFDVKATMVSGMYAGSLTNTPALAGVVDLIKTTAPADTVEMLMAEPVVAYSLSYPMGTLGVILVIFILQRAWKIDYAAEARQARELGPLNEPLQSITLRVLNTQTLTIAELIRQNDWNVVFGRYKRAEAVKLVTGPLLLEAGDYISLVGTIEELNSVQKTLGEAVEERLEFDLSHFDKRRVFISNPKITGRRLSELNLVNTYGAMVTRLRRGDLEVLPHGQTTLMLGDQVRVIAPHNQMENVIQLFGDSYRGVSEIDVLTFSLGLALGLLLGMVPIHLPGGLTLKLGMAGGPLIVALVLGALGRTGPVIWQIPYSANLTLRQIGLILFLAGIGTRAGYSFISMITQGNGPIIFIAGALVTCLTMLVTMWVGYKLLHIPMGLLTGMVAGLQTAPAALGFATEQSHNELPNIGYATVYPVAMISKILLAQALLLMFM